MKFRIGKMSMLAWTESDERERPQLGSDEPQRRMTDCCSHFTDLAIPTFRESHLKPCCRNAFSVSDRYLSERDRRLGIKERHKSSLGFSPFNCHSCSQPGEGFLTGDAFDLHQIGALVSIARFQKEMLCRTVVREKEKALALCVKPPDGVDITREWTECFESLSPGIVGELGEDPIWLIEKYVGTLNAGRSFYHFVTPQKNPPASPRDLCLFKATI
jgi:hypothetical protein